MRSLFFPVFLRRWAHVVAQETSGRCGITGLLRHRVFIRRHFIGPVSCPKVRLPGPLVVLVVVAAVSLVAPCCGHPRTHAPPLRRRERAIPAGDTRADAGAAPQWGLLADLQQHLQDRNPERLRAWVEQQYQAWRTFQLRGLQGPSQQPNAQLPPALPDQQPRQTARGQPGPGQPGQPPSQAPDSIPTRAATADASRPAGSTPSSPVVKNKEMPSKCVFAVVACCESSTSEPRLGCFEQLECDGPFWDRSPCEPAVLDASLARLAKFYGRKPRKNHAS